MPVPRLIIVRSRVDGIGDHLRDRLGEDLDDLYTYLRDHLSIYSELKIVSRKILFK